METRHWQQCVATMREVPCNMLSIIAFLYPQQIWTDSEQFDSEPSDNEDSDQGEHEGEESNNEQELEPDESSSEFDFEHDTP